MMNEKTNHNIVDGVIRLFCKFIRGKDLVK